MCNYIRTFKKLRCLNLIYKGHEIKDYGLFLLLDTIRELDLFKHHIEINHSGITDMIMDYMTTNTVEYTTDGTIITFSSP